MNSMIYKGRKTKVTEVSYNRRRFLTWIVLLMFCLSLFCSDAGALPYRYINTGESYVSGLYSSGSGTWNGSDFGDMNTPGWVIGIANNDNGYGIRVVGGDLTIIGDLREGSIIGGVAADEQGAYGLFSDEGDSIHTDALNGTIYAIAGTEGAVGLYDFWGDINTGDIGGTIDATAGEGHAYGFYSWYGDVNTGDISGQITTIAEGNSTVGLFSVVGEITTGDITGTIDVTAGASYAAGLASDYNSVTTGDITGTIIARADANYAYGLYSNGVSSIHTGDINGIITVDVNDGSDAYALYSDSNITTGDIGSDAQITASAGQDRAYGLYSRWGDVNTGDIDGTIDANAGGDRARGLFGWDSITTGDINGTITATAGGDEAAGLFSGGTLTTGDITGTIDANTAGYYARGLFGANSITTGDITGSITATAGQDYAAGLYSVYGDVNIGDINGTISAEATNGYVAYAIHSGSNMTIGNIGSNSDISATARYGKKSAYGIYSSNTLSILDINGIISAEVLEGSSAYAIYAANDITIGNIGSDALITANATGIVNGEKSAYGIYSSESLTILDINGTITADMNNGDWAYAIYAVNDITIGDIYSDANISATASESAYGMYSEDGSIDVCDIDGTISADANNNYAYALYTADSSSHINVGDIGNNAHITASAGEGNAIGMFSSGPITTGSINGEISASTGQQEAYALWSYGDLTVNGDIGSSAYIWASTGGSTAYALFSDDSIYVNGDINGDIYAVANNNAFGLYSIGLSTIETGDINGTIIAEAINGSYAYALYSDSGIEVGDIGSTALISATAEDGYAYGLYSAAGDSIHTGDINGIITADVNNGNNAYGMYSNSDITVGNIGSDAEITATINHGFGAGGLRSNNGSIDVCDIDGAITVTAGAHAYGLLSDGGDITTGAINGDINTTVGYSRAFGLFADGGSINITGDVNGTIAATARGLAYGLASYDGSITTQAINGEITATATTGSRAYGLYSDNNSITTGDINGVITATAEDGDAYGLYSGGGDSIHTGDINGTISAEVNDGSWAVAMYSYGDIIIDGNIGGDAQITGTAGQNRAYGLCSQTGDVNTGNIDGTIDANAGRDYARGLFSWQSIYTGDINGVITATAGDDEAAGLYSYNGSIETGDIDGTITATAEDRNAYGLYSRGSSSINTGNINGIITADTNTGSWAAAMYSYGDITIDGNIGIYAQITASAGQNRAYGLCSQWGDVNTGDIDGTVDANAKGDYARGLFSGQSIYTGDIGGTITATAGDDEAAALYSLNGSIETGDITGTITATAEDRDAYGLYSGGSSSINTGDIDGIITADTNTGSWAAAMYADSNITTGDIGSYAQITATAGQNSAYGLCSQWGDVNTGDIDGTITATAGGDRARGLWSGQSIYTDAITGTITATAGGDEAAGLHSWGENSLIVGPISGTIDANAEGDFAYGILSYGPMDVTITGGTISAVAHDGNNVAAIQSGRRSFGGPLETQDANDILGITAGSTIIGDINLGIHDEEDGDNDVMTLSTGVDADSNTTFGDDIMNIETINITGGTWYVDGNISDSNNGITMTGGYLGGHGTLCSLHVIDGIFAPGNSIDTIYIDGNWTHDPNGIHEVEVNKDMNSDRTIVTGWADLDGTIHCIAPTASGERINETFRALIIDANTGLYNAFDTLTASTLFPIFFDIYDYDNNDVYLDVIFDYAYYTDTDNQHSVGDAFNCIVRNGLDTNDMNDVLWAIEHLDDYDAVNKAYNQMMPQDMLGLPDVTRQIMNQHNESIMSRMDNLRRARQYVSLKNSRYLLASADNAAALPPKSETDEWMPFVKGIGVWGDRDKETDIAGYKYSVYGAIGGMDKLVSDNMLFGFGVGFARTKVDYTQAGTDADIDSLLFSLHGSYFIEDDWHLDWTAAYGHNSYDLQRKINFDDINRTATSDHKGNAYSAAIEFGKDFGDDSMILEPIAGMGYTYVKEKGYTESGAQSLNLKVDSETSDGFYSKLGVRVAKEIRPEDNPDMVMVPKLSAFWIHDFADRVEIDSSFIGGCGFKTKGLDPVKNTINIGAGLNVYFSNNLRVFVDYIWQSASDFDSSMAQAGAQWSF